MFTSDGYLPFFLLYAGGSAIVHSAVCFLAPAASSMKLFSGPNSPQEKELLARVYGLKNIYTGLIRLVTAFNIGERYLYDLTICTFIGVLFYTLLELGVYRTIRPREGAFGLVTAGTGLLWMASQRAFYIY